MAYLFVMAHSRQTQRYLVVSLFLPFNVNKQVTYRLKPTAAHLKATSNSLLSTFSSHVQESVNNIEPCFQGNPGLYNALVASNAHTVWVGTLKTPVPEDEQSDIQAELIANYNSYPIFPSEKELDGHYNQFCKNVLWKPFHYQLDGYSKPSLCDEQAWEDYKCINMLFCIKVAEIYQPGDIIWINDYHLMLAPEILRKMLPNATIGFFLHIPFPSSEIFRCIYVRKELLHGMLGSDLIGFQTHSFLRQFLSTCSRLLAVPIHLKSIQLPNSSVSVGQYPIGIDHVSLQKKICHPEVNHLKDALREKYQGKLLVIGRDKNDYVKGVTHKLIAFEKFLEMYPEWIGKVVLIQVSLYTIESNDNGKQVSEMVTKINSKYGTISYTPVVYLHQDISFNHYLALLSIADVFLITCLSDGMNLTSHEYVVCQSENHGPLIISEFAGTYGSFGAALRINPWDHTEVANAINEALSMTKEEKYYRWKMLYHHVQMNTAQKYVETFVGDLQKSHEENLLLSSITCIDFAQIFSAYKQTVRRIWFLDDCGTLRVPCSKKVDCIEDHSMIDILQKLCADPGNIVYLMSGRQRQDLEPLDQIKGLGISAENGSFVKLANKKHWQVMLRNEEHLSWRKKVLEIFEYYTDRTPGTFIECKEIGISWHYGESDKSFGSWQAAELQNHLSNTLLTMYPIIIFHTESRIEVMPRNVSKGRAIKRALSYHSARRLSYSSSQNSPQSPVFEICQSSILCDFDVARDSLNVSDAINFQKLSFDFVFVAGNDRADEAMFECFSADTGGSLEGVDSVKTSIFTCTVGSKTSLAKYFVESPTALKNGIDEILNEDTTSEK